MWWGMNNRLICRIEEALRKRRKLFCAYLTLGFPNLSVTRNLIPVLERSGTDILELGFPFSDPLADGPTIQKASERALKNGVTVHDALGIIRSLRKKGLSIPILFFSYINPVLRYGVKRLADDLARNGFDGLIIPDLSLEEGRFLEPVFKRVNLSLVYLIAPTTDKARAREIAKRSSGFVYYVSIRGVTGARYIVPRDLIRNVKQIKRLSRKPVLVGFGVSQVSQARAIAAVADGVIVGSAIVNQISKSKAKDVSKQVAKLVSRLAASIQRKPS